MQWTTRNNIMVDQVACPWLIRRFVGPEAECLFVNEDELLEAPSTQQAIGFDARPFPEAKLNHGGGRYSLDAAMDDHVLENRDWHGWHSLFGRRT